MILKLISTYNILYRISNPFYSNKLGSKLHQGCYKLLNMFLIAKYSVIHEGAFEQNQPTLEMFKEKKIRRSLSSLLSSLFQETPQKLSPSVSFEATLQEESEEDTTLRKEKIIRLATELCREVNRFGDSQSRRQVLRMINKDLTSRRGILNASFISDEGNVSGSETSSVLLTEAVIENCQQQQQQANICQIPEITITSVEEADQVPTSRPHHLDLGDEEDTVR